MNISMTKIFFRQLAQIKSAITWKWTFLDFIFQMQVSLGNKESFGKWARFW